MQEEKKEEKTWTSGKELVHWILNRQLPGDLLLEHLDWKDVVRLAAASPVLWRHVESMVEAAYKHCLPDVFAICYGNVPSRLWVSLMTSVEFEDRAEYMQVFGECALNGDHKTAEWLADRLQITGADVKACSGNNAFWNVCRSGNLPMAQWFVDRFEVEYSDCFNRGVETIRHPYALRCVCRNGHIHVAEWLVDRFGISGADVRRECNTVALSICNNGQLEALQWLIHRFDLSRFDVVEDNFTFLNACLHGHLRVAKWMAEEYNMTREEVSWPDEKPLVYACGKGHTALAKWLCKTYGFKRNYAVLHAEGGMVNDAPRWAGALTNAFERGCGKGTLKHVQWMIKHFGLTHDEVRGRNDMAMEWATKRNKLETALWLAKTYYVNKVTDRVRRYLEEVCSPGVGWRHEFIRDVWLDLARATNRDHPYLE